MIFADDMDRYKTLNKFEFWPDRTIDFDVTCPLVSQKHMFNHVRSITCLVLIGSL